MTDDYLPPLPPALNQIGSVTTGEQRSTIGNGPFGLVKGLRKEDFGLQITEISPFVYQAETLPRKHSAFQYYFVQITPVQGLSWIKSVGNPISTNPYGTEILTAFSEMKAKLEKIYGRAELIDFLMHDSIWDRPRDWMQALQDGERCLASSWKNNRNNQMPSDLESVFLHAGASDTYTGYIAIEYAFNNKEASDQEISMLEDDAL